MGSNANAVRLYAEDGDVIDLSNESNNTVIPILNQKKENNMKLIAIELGLKEDATEAEVLSALGNILSSEKTNKENFEKLQSERIEILLKSKAVTDDNKKDIEKLAATDFNLASKMVTALEGNTSDNNEETVRLSAAINKTKTGKAGDAKDKTWKEHTDAELETLRADDKAGYVKLFAAEYGHEPKID